MNERVARQNLTEKTAIGESRFMMKPCEVHSGAGYVNEVA